jgi:predicted amidohydrolase
MTLDLYYRLCSRSRKAFKKTKKRWGRNYQYRPRGDLLQRLSQETGLSLWEVNEKLKEERREYLENLERQGFLPSGWSV